MDLVQNCVPLSCVKSLNGDASKERAQTRRNCQHRVQCMYARVNAQVAQQSRTVGGKIGLQEFFMDYSDLPHLALI